MANIYYSDPSGTNLNVFEKKTKGGEPFYYIYLNKNKITESDVGKLTKVMQDTLPNATIKTKKGKVAFQVTWSYNSPTPLMSEKKLFDAMFSYLNAYPYVDDYQSKSSSKTSTPAPLKSPYSYQQYDFFVDKGFDTLNLILNVDTDGSVKLLYFSTGFNNKTIDVVFNATEVRNSLNSGTLTLLKIDEGDKFETKDKSKSVTILGINNFKVQYKVEEAQNTIYDEQDLLDFKVGLVENNYLYAGRQTVTQASTQNSGISIKPLKFNDLFQDNGGQLYSLATTDSGSLDVDDDELLHLDFLDSNNNMAIQQIPYNQILKNIENGLLEYLGQVRVGDEFEKGIDAIVITKFENNVVSFRNTNIQSGIFKLYLPQFVYKLLEEGFKLIRRGTQAQGTPTPTTNPLRSRFKSYALFESDNSKQLFRITNIEGDISDLKDSDKIYFEGKNVLTGQIESNTYEVKIFELLFEKNGGFNFIGNVDANQEFVSKNKIRRVIRVRNINSTLGNDIIFDIIDANTSVKLLAEDSLNEASFTFRLVDSDYKLVQKNNVAQDTNIPTSEQTETTQVSESINPLTNTEINALRKELSDLLFLKSGISDLDFEDKINIATEIYEVQRKIDALNEKLFEQKVGDDNFFDRLFEQSFTPLKDRYDMVIQKNQLPEIISPSGEISDLDERLQTLINTTEFKDWFGDWRNAFFYRNLEDFGGINVSKVMNEKFEPQLVWHGTNNEFSYFDFEMFPANYFAVNREYSEFFATNKGGVGYVLPFFLNIKNPLDLSDFGIDNVPPKDFFDWMYLMTGMTPEELEVNPLFLDPSAPSSPIWVYIRNNPTMLKKIAQGRVYDGIKFYEFNPNVDPTDTLAYQTLAYIIFDPHQAKLADPDRGEILLATLKSFMLKRGGKI